MNYDEYDEKKSSVNKEIGDIQEEYQNTRIELEHRFDEQLEIGNKQKQEIEEKRTEFNQKASLLLNAADEFYSSSDARAADNLKANYEVVHDKVQEYSDQLQKLEDQTDEGLKKLNQDYQDLDDQLLSDYSKQLNQKQEELDKLKKDLDD